jgi:hypothetical protein
MRAVPRSLSYPVAVFLRDKHVQRFVDSPGSRVVRTFGPTVALSFPLCGPVMVRITGGKPEAVRTYETGGVGEAGGASQSLSLQQ